MTDFEISKGWVRLRFAAWLSFAAHLIAGLAMALVLRHGLETNPDVHERLRFLVGQRPLWIGAWLTWQAAAFSILYFYVSFVRAHWAGDETPRISHVFAVVLSTAAIVADLSAESMEMVLLPEIARPILAQGSAASLEAFHMLHRTCVLLTGYLANGLYTLAAILLVWSTRQMYPRWVFLAGLGVGFSGLFLSVAAFVNSKEGMFWSNVLLTPSLLVWLAGVAVDATRRARRSG